MILLDVTISEVFVPISDGFVPILFSYNGYISVFEVYLLFQKFRRKFCSYFVIILMGVHLFFRHLFYSRSSYVSFVPIDELFFLFCYYFNGFYLFLRYLFYSRSSYVSFVPIFRKFVPILEVLGTKLQN